MPDICYKVCCNLLILQAVSRKKLMRFVSVLPSLLLLFVLNLASAASPQIVREDALVKNYPAGTIQTVQQASAALAEVRATRKEVEDDYTQTRNDCLEKFFMAVCFERAKDRRRQALAAIRKVEIEASAYLRKEKADERDRGVAERQRNAALPQDGTGMPFKGATRPESAPNEPAPKEPAPDEPSDKP